MDLLSTMPHTNEMASVPMVTGNDAGSIINISVEMASSPNLEYVRATRLDAYGMAKIGTKIGMMLGI